MFDPVVNVLMSNTFFLQTQSAVPLIVSTENTESPMPDWFARLGLVLRYLIRAVVVWFPIAVIVYFVWLRFHIEDEKNTK